MHFIKIVLCATWLNFPQVMKFTNKKRKKNSSELKASMGAYATGFVGMNNV